MALQPRDSQQAILPGAVIGVLGSGQLGRMFALAARRMGYRVHVLSPDQDTPTGQVADVEHVADYGDLDAVRQFASQAAVITFEFENVPFATAQAAAQFAPVRPAGEVLHVTQQRVREKTFLSKHGIPVAHHAVVRNVHELAGALTQIKPPAVLKTAGFGYDGKGQIRIGRVEEAGMAWERLRTDEAVLEAFVDFAKEVSVVAARGLRGDFAHWGVVENVHANHVLDVTTAPAELAPELQRQAIAITRSIMEELQVVGVLCVEFFATRDGKLLVNELAPRPHNSGHFTIDACVTSQFEQQLRAICGLPLGQTTQHHPAAMANLLGDVWERGEPNWPAALGDGMVKLHLYGKSMPRPGRKMGHLTALGSTGSEARSIVLKAREALIQA